MAKQSTPDSQALRRFLRRVWCEDVAPLLRDKRAAQRRKSARVSGKVAATTGLFVDGLFGLKGKPFTRFMTVVGASLGAMLPDVWDWRWFRESADREQQRVVAEKVAQRARKLPEVEALELFGLGRTATRDQLKHAWRSVSQRWHPDKVPDQRQRAEYHVRFVAYQAAYELLCRAYDEGRLPSADGG
ncbi:MAG: J domain-containing protein [Planctomycetes bacterium]|nr:J domain-containing protein [Planctomycetota bacterium]